MFVVARRGCWVHVKVSESERAAWRQAAAAGGITLSDMIRDYMSTALVGRSPRVRRLAAPPVDPRLLTGVAKIGNNLNQLARWANTYQRAADAATVLVALASIERELAQLLPDHRNAH